jgi:predicted 3-demethylubiquinone-9 3-methyltransferase (glyoxalase superfamily)
VPEWGGKDFDMHAIQPTLWFNGNAIEARDFYCSVFKDSEVLQTANYTAVGPGKEGEPVTVRFRLNGVEFVGINAGPEFTFSEAVSFLIPCEDQDEVDYYWEELTNGGEEGPCGWLKDKFGLSWQVVPRQVQAMLIDPDREAADRMVTALYGMGKIDLAALEAAFEGE